MDCRAQDFSSGLVVSNATVGGDSGAFFTPFILDPQNSGELLVGTCRVWRGATDGSGFSALTNNFETGGAESCTGSEVNLVRALAAGGIKGTAGILQRDVRRNRRPRPASFRPAAISGWRPTSAAERTRWFDRTGTTNPSGFPDLGSRSRQIGPDRQNRLHDHHGLSRLSCVEDDQRRRILDDFTASLPDAPANAVLVDAAASTVYVGTDVGVFASSTASPDWTEVGPAPEQR